MNKRTMKTTLFNTLIIAALFLTACKKHKVEKIETRTFKMGFSSWSYGPTLEDRTNNYELIKANGDIISEQVDDRIPWNSWINGDDLPTDFVADIDGRVAQISTSHQLLLSISPLNTDRSNFIENWDGSGVPSYSTMDDPILENAYVEHVSYLVDRFNPDYLVISMESTDLQNKSQEKWTDFKTFMRNVRTRIKEAYPTLQIAESVVLHNWLNPEVDDPAAYQAEIKAYVTEMDFAAISFYPFFAGQHSSKDFQEAFDFLHENVDKPIAFVETTHLANDLEVAAYTINIKSSAKEQANYARALLNNAAENDYLFVIWWSYRDYDKLWETFDPSIQDIGKLWRDTGLEDENGNARPALEVWKTIFEK